MKIIVAGCGKVGKSVIAGLCAEGHDITVIDTDPDVISSVTEEYDVMGIVGNGADSDILKECGAGETDLFVSATESDELNMLSCFLAGRFGAKSTVARIRNPEYNDSSLDVLKKELGLSHAINPELLAANEIYNILRFPSAVKIETFSKGLEMVELKLKDDSALAGLTLLQLREQYNAKILVCCVQRGDEVTIPGGSFVLRGGDQIGITGTQSEINKFMRRVGIFQKKSKNIMILGGSRIGFYLAQKIIAGGSEVCIIDRDREVCEVLCEQLPEARIINADGTEHNVLIEEGLLSSDAFVALTGFDEENILISIFAISESVPKVVTKINGDALLRMAGRLNLDTVISPKDPVTDMTIKYARALENSRGSNVLTLYKLFDGKVEALEFRATEEAKAIGVELRSMKLKKNILLAGIVRNGKTIIPGGLDSIQPDDRVIVIAAGCKVGDLDDILA